MNITVDRNGNRKVRLTKTELKVIDKARIICEVLEDNDYFPDGRDKEGLYIYVSSGLADLIERLGEQPTD